MSTHKSVGGWVHPGERVCVPEGCSCGVGGVYGGAHTSEGWSSAWCSAQQGEGGSTSPALGTHCSGPGLPG